MSNPVVGDLGTIIYVQLKQEDGTAIDLSLVTSMSATVTRPGATPETIVLVNSTHPNRLPADGWAQYTTAKVVPSFFTVKGTYKIRPKAVITGVGEWTATAAVELVVNA